MVAEEPFIHERALVETDDVGNGTRVWAFAQVMSGARVGAGCNICGHVFIEQGAVVGDRVTVKNNVQLWDGVTIEDDVFLGPNATFTNDLTPRAQIKKPSEQLLRTVVRRGSTIGANATILCGITIGEFGFVAAGAVVTKDVNPYALVVGNPGKRVGWVCQCGGRLSSDLRCRSCGRRYRQAANGAIAPVENDVRSSR
jgi:UDP-2-acetamido-3-amino-2,3-dideoxy-glucuronate N-acetyltransferase